MKEEALAESNALRRFAQRRQREDERREGLIEELLFLNKQLITDDINRAHGVVSQRRRARREQIYFALGWV